MTQCAAPIGTNKITFMKDVTNLKIEAKHLLNEVNHHVDTSSNGERISNSPYDIERRFEDHSFKERLNDLKQKINAVSFENIALHNF